MLPSGRTAPSRAAPGPLFPLGKSDGRAYPSAQTAPQGTSDASNRYSSCCSLRPQAFRHRKRRLQRFCIGRRRTGLSSAWGRNRHGVPADSVADEYPEGEVKSEVASSNSGRRDSLEYPVVNRCAIHSSEVLRLCTVARHQPSVAIVLVFGRSSPSYGREVTQDYELRCYSLSPVPDVR